MIGCNNDILRTMVFMHMSQVNAIQYYLF